MKFTNAKKAIALTGAIAMLASVAACGSDSNDSQPAQEKDAKEITVWAWEPTLTQVAKDFEKETGIKVNLKNVGTNTKEYTQLDNAIEAGSGAPDVAQVEYYALPQYAIKGNLLDITDKTSGYEDFYTPGPWASVQFSGKVYGLPMDSGPMAFFYNKTVFDKAGVTEAPKTWDEFYETAKKIRATGSYIINDTGDVGIFESMVWQAGGTPFVTKDNAVSLSLTSDAGVRKVLDLWQRLIDEDLIDTTTKDWTDDWNRGFGDGSIAATIKGAWMPANLVSGAPSAAGQWRVAPIPQWSESGPRVNAENGGSSLQLVAGSEDNDAAWQFLEYATHSREGIDTRVKLGAFPADNGTLESEDFLKATTIRDSDGKNVDYFGGQAFNEVLAQAAAEVKPGFEFLPFEVYARTVYTDAIGPGFIDGSRLSDHIKQWQDILATYGKSQGFDIATKTTK